jgi:hypothetical protein
MNAGPGRRARGLPMPRGRGTTDLSTSRCGRRQRSGRLGLVTGPVNRAASGPVEGDILAVVRSVESGEVIAMDEATLRAELARQFEHGAHDMYDEDAILEFPQSGERFVGVANFQEWRSVYPASVDLEIRRIRGRGDLWIAEILARYDGGPWNFGVSIHEFREKKIVHETIYVNEGWEAPEWRARWRTGAPTEGLPAPAPDEETAPKQ